MPVNGKLHWDSPHCQRCVAGTAKASSATSLQLSKLWLSSTPGWQCG